MNSSTVVLQIPWLELLKPGGYPLPAFQSLPWQFTWVTYRLPPFCLRASSKIPKLTPPCLANQFSIRKLIFFEERWQASLLETNRKSSEASRQDLHTHSWAPHSHRSLWLLLRAKQTKQQSSRLPWDFAFPLSHSPPPLPFPSQPPYHPGTAADTFPVNLRFSKTINLILPVATFNVEMYVFDVERKFLWILQCHGCPVEYGFTFLRDSRHVCILDDHNVMDDITDS